MIDIKNTNNKIYFDKFKRNIYRLIICDIIIKWKLTFKQFLIQKYWKCWERMNKSIKSRYIIKWKGINYVAIGISFK